MLFKKTEFMSNLKSAQIFKYECSKIKLSVRQFKYLGGIIQMNVFVSCGTPPRSYYMVGIPGLDQ